MSKYVVMPKEDWEDILEATREKTGSTEPIKSGELSGKIRGLGGSGDDIWRSIVNKNITEIKDDTLKAIGDYAFYGCTILTSVDFPNVSTIAPSAFRTCETLSSVNLPKVKIIYDAAFRDCWALTIVDLPDVHTIGNTVFGYCETLTVVILRNTTKICVLNGKNNFVGTPFADGAGKLLLPAALVQSYQQATYWADVYNNGNKFLPLEEYTVDGTTTGALDWDKINAA